MNKIEKQLFWELCSFIKPNKHKLKLLLNEGATPEVLGQLFFNRMQAVAYGVLKESELLHELNREFRNSLAYAYQQNVEKTGTKGGNAFLQRKTDPKQLWSNTVCVWG